MAKLKCNGTELLRVDRLWDRISVRSTGIILRDQGRGWKRWRWIPVGKNPVEWAEEQRAKAAEAHARDTAANRFRAELHRRCPALPDRAQMYFLLRDYAAEGAGKVAVCGGVSQEDAEALIPLYRAALDEAIARKHETKPIEDI